jgi:flagellin
MKNDMAITKSLEKLSSGLKINRAADNAAGLIISEQLRAQLGGLQQAMSNTEQAVALVQTAEGALDEMSTLLSKAKKLALASMSDATSDSDQSAANQKELANILTSLGNIATNTQYAKNKLLDGSFSAKKVQIGSFDGQSTEITIATMTTAALSLAGISVSGVTAATSALGQIEAAITTVANARGDLGAIQANILETTLNSLRTSYENLKSAESTIRDVDFAEESANFTRNTILVQSATSMLAQANQLPQNVLKLLG